VDLETLAGARDGVLEEVLSGNERRALAGLPADAAERRFLALWTAKEASAKALGVGCAMDLARIDVDLDGRRAHLEDGIGNVHATLGLNVARIRSRDAELCLAVATV
jgi:phosphopantetheinyl transferase